MATIWKCTKIPSGLHCDKSDGVNRIYLYNIGWFRGKEKMYVVSTLYKKGRTNTAFKTKIAAMKFIAAYKKRN